MWCIFGSIQLWGLRKSVCYVSFWFRSQQRKVMMRRDWSNDGIRWLFHWKFSSLFDPQPALEQSRLLLTVIVLKNYPSYKIIVWKLFLKWEISISFGFNFFGWIFFLFLFFVLGAFFFNESLASKRPPSCHPRLKLRRCQNKKETQMARWQLVEIKTDQKFGTPHPATWLDVEKLLREKGFSLVE